MALVDSIQRLFASGKPAEETVMSPRLQDELQNQKAAQNKQAAEGAQAADMATNAWQNPGGNIGVPPKAGGDIDIKSVIKLVTSLFGG